MLTRSTTDQSCLSFESLLCFGPEFTETVPGVCEEASPTMRKYSMQGSPQPGADELGLCRFRVLV